MDLVLSNEEHMVENIKYLPGLGSSDHVLLDFDFNCFINVNKCAFKKLNFFKGDYNYNSTNQASLAIPWNGTLGGLSLSESWKCLTEKINNSVRSYVPVSKANTLKKKPPMTSQCALAIKNKHRRWMKYKYCKSVINLQQYKAARNKVSSELRKAKYLYENDLALKIKDNNKLFWSYVRSKSKTKMSVCKLDSGNGELTKKMTKRLLMC